ncbi:MAG: hypothetical protein II814_03485 [Treponema sp.]|nr:hypothetical protein [Treponema sp.]
MIFCKVRKSGRNYDNNAIWYREGFNVKYQKKTWVNWAGGFCFQDENDEIIAKVDMSEEQFENTYRKELYEYLLEPGSDLGWLAPDGTFYGCDWAHHVEFAECYLGKEELELEKSGWVKIFRSFELGEPVYCQSKLTSAQRDYLESHCIKYHYC